MNKPMSTSILEIVLVRYQAYPTDRNRCNKVFRLESAERCTAVTTAERKASRTV